MATEVESKKLIKGNITKKPEPGAPDYRKAWIANVNEYNRSKPHPFCHGIQMDTHHLISEKALDKCDFALQDNLRDKGYNINSLGNLVGIPATFRGACHLGTQVHRSDHKFKKNQFDEIVNYDYHETIKDLVTEKKQDINECYGTTAIEESERYIHKEIMDKVSQRALRRIANFTLPLTSIHTNFERPQDPEEPYIGCGEGEKVGDVKGGKKCCEKKGNHNGEFDSRPSSSFTLDTAIDFPQNWALKRKI